MHTLTNHIRAYTLKNSLEHGKANPGKILPKLFQHGLQKSQIKDIIQEIQQTVKKVNKLDEKEKQSQYEKLKHLVKERQEQEEGLKPLPNSKKGKIILRAAPFPSGAIHLGNAKTFLINALYTEKYKGKLILVMDDTIGSVEKPIEKEAYKLIEEAFDWLKIKHAGKIIYKSDRLKIYYKYVDKLIKKDKAYVCHCTQEEVRENRREGKDCSCRVFPVKIQLKRWKEMFKAKEGKATLRIKTSMQHPNPAFRDRVLFKISDRLHPRTGKKFRIWPTLEMSWAIDDYLLKITHIIRGNDLMIETDMEKYIWDILGWKHPTVIHTGLVNFTGISGKISKSKSQKEVKSGKFKGWDDPRTWSIQSLMKRGIKVEAIRKFIEDIGLNKQDITIPIDSLYSINRSLIDSIADRYSFIEKPVKLRIKNSPNWEEIEIPVHPDKLEKRKIIIDDIFISKKDLLKYKNEEVRLLHLYNIKLHAVSEVTSIEDVVKIKLNWVSQGVPAKILFPDGKWTKGIADSGIKDLNKSQIIQFERFGFVRFDKKINDVFEFWFSHK